MISATCSQCGLIIKAKTKANLLSTLRKHLWKFHRAWMVKRIKAGRAKNVGNPPVLKLLKDLATGDFVPSYKAYKRESYETLKPTLDIVAKFMPVPVQQSWKVVDKLASIIFRK